MRPAALLRLAYGIAVGLMAASTAATPSSAPIPDGLYNLTIETVLPHLEEALRYATVRSTRCIAGETADSFFPVLQHEALAGCSLVAVERSGTFMLNCLNPQAANGVAKFEHSPDGMRAVLELKMGGKNMTLAQRVVGSRLGACR